MKKFKTELLIIGAGPSGLGAAIYAARAALDFFVVEKFIAGGQIVVTEFIENYPGFKDDVSGFDLMQSIIEHCKKFNINIHESQSIESMEILRSGRKSKCKFVCRGQDIEVVAGSIIIATGASPRRLYVEGENEFIGNGISFCATCDGALYRDKEVMVIGGGDTAIQEAMFLVKFASKVYIVHRRDELRAVKSLQAKAFAQPKIEFLFDSVVDRFTGGNKLEEVTIKNVKTNEKTVKKIDGVFEYVGIKPNSDFLKGFLKMDEWGFIITDEKMSTSVSGIFAAGDVRVTPLRQVITAVSDGAVAATFADKYLDDLD
ncbi:MAG: thioredoxin-disulfide reductase [Actinobacteria bacterium]|nr:thioredoxin-disulfide reductase [Actinomycetota bacterium]